MSPARRVAIVVDPDFGERLADLSRTQHVWACNSPRNRAALDLIWSATLVPSVDHGITTFNMTAGATPEESCLAVLRTIDLRRGEPSPSPAGSVLDVFGAALSPALEAALRKLGFDTFETREGGFVASRSPNT